MSPISDELFHTHPLYAGGVRRSVPYCTVLLVIDSTRLFSGGALRRSLQPVVKGARYSSMVCGSADVACAPSSN